MKERERVIYQESCCVSVLVLSLEGEGGASLADTLEGTSLLISDTDLEALTA